MIKRHLAHLSFLHLGPIPDVIVTELFFQSSRASAFVIGGSVDWLCNFMTGFAFVFIKVRCLWPIY